MPRGFIPHYDNLLGYTFPITIQVIDEIGVVPERLVDIPQPFQQQLLATLAIELAIVARGVLVQQGHIMSFDQAEAALIERYGGKPYALICDNIDGLYEMVERARKVLEDLARDAVGTYDSELKDTLSSVISVGPDGVPVRWHYDTTSAKHIDAIRRRIEAMWNTRRTLELALLRARNTRDQLRQEIRAKPGFQSELQDWRWRLNVDFSKGWKYQAEGAAYFLRNLDYSWWVKFTTGFEAHVKRDVRAPARVAMRDPRVLERIRHYMPLLDWYGAISKYFTDYPLEWGVGEKKKGALAKIRKDLPKEDAVAMKWLIDHGRPKNFYSVWIAKLLRRSKEQQYWSPSPVDVQWWHNISQMLPPDSPRDDEDMRINELSWCLSRGGGAKYVFEIFAKSPEVWTAHRNQWWATIEAARFAST